MSKDITAFKTLYNNSVIGTDLKDDIASFTMSHKLNDYWRAYDLLTSEYDLLMIIQYDTVYVYNRSTLLKILGNSKKLNLGEDVEQFLKSCIESNCENVYMKII
jgi:hypothetical protein